MSHAAPQHTRRPRRAAPTIAPLSALPPAVAAMTERAAQVVMQLEDDPGDDPPLAPWSRIGFRLTRLRSGRVLVHLDGDELGIAEDPAEVLTMLATLRVFAPERPRRQRRARAPADATPAGRLGRYGYAPFPRGQR